ncbi:MAG: hypothetical protein HYW78_03685 [Parcubacteria group bacterium]|nr:hypothetical protein [Parcubacteria group bacterium]
MDKKWSKYLVVIDEIMPSNIVKQSDKITVVGEVWTGEPRLYRILDDSGKVVQVEGFAGTELVKNAPKMFVDIYTVNDTPVLQETKTFSPETNGVFSFTVDTTSYTPASYSLLVFYAEGEEPDAFEKCDERFVVISPEQYRDDEYIEIKEGVYKSTHKN